jgi:hypothetical protein
MKRVHLVTVVRAKLAEDPLSRRNTTNCLNADYPDFTDEAFQRASPNAHPPSG